MTEGQPKLVVFTGLPGVGKSTVARPLAATLEATYLRIDTIEVAIGSAGVRDVGAAGYTVANALAADNLALGRVVVADCVNPVAASRTGWRAVAAAAGARLAEIRLVCSDQVEHRRRVEAKRDDIEGSIRPTWQDVLAHGIEPWDGAPHLLVDTATTSVAEAVAACAAFVEGRA